MLLKEMHLDMLGVVIIFDKVFRFNKEIEIFADQIIKEIKKYFKKENKDFNYDIKIEKNNILFDSKRENLTINDTGVGFNIKNIQTNEEENIFTFYSDLYKLILPLIEIDQWKMFGLIFRLDLNFKEEINIKKIILDNYLRLPKNKILELGKDIELDNLDFSLNYSMNNNWCILRIKNETEEIISIDLDYVTHIYEKVKNNYIIFMKEAYNYYKNNIGNFLSPFFDEKLFDEKFLKKKKIGG